MILIPELHRDEPSVWDHPIDHLEPVVSPADQIRDAQLMCVRMLGDFAVQMLDALSGNDPVKTALARLFGVSFAMGLSITDGHSMSEKADQIGCTRATISKISTAWNIAHDLPPAWGQKSEVANQRYAQVRREVVKANGNGQRRNAAPRHEAFPVPPRKGGRSV